MKIHCTSGILLMLLAGAPVAGHSDSTQKPLWEFGVAMATFQAPNYRGDDQSKLHFIPFPYFIYRGEFLNVTREGVQGLIYESERFKINLSGNASTSVESNETSRRKGMPDLDASIEIGPALDIVISKDRVKETEFGISLTLRTAISTDFRSFRHQGWVSNPHVYYFNEKFGPDKNLDFTISAGPVFADREYHDFYYKVDPAYVTPTRSAFKTSGGYSGMRSTVSLSRTFGKIWIGAFVRFDHFGGTKYADSPLVARQSFLLAGIAATYLITEAKTKVDY